MTDDKIFSDDYSSSEKKTSTDTITKASNNFEVDTEKYGLNKPQRIIIKGKITHGESN